MEHIYIYTDRSNSTTACACLRDLDHKEDPRTNDTWHLARICPFSFSLVMP